MGEKVAGGWWLVVSDEGEEKTPSRQVAEPHEFDQVSSGAGEWGKPPPRSIGLRPLRKSGEWLEKEEAARLEDRTLLTTWRSHTSWIR